MKIKLLALITLFVLSSCDNMFNSFLDRSNQTIPRIFVADYAAGGYIYVSDDGGATWAQRGIPNDWVSIASNSDGTKLVAAVQSDDIYRSNDGGVTWNPLNVDLVNRHYWASVAMSSDGTKLVATDYYVVGPPVSTGNIYSSVDSGSTWVADMTIATGPDSAVYCTTISMSSDGTKYATVNSGISGLNVYIYNGSSWIYSNVDGAVSHQFAGIATSSDFTKIVVGAPNTSYLFRSVDSGSTWTPLTGAGTGEWFALASSSDGTKLVAADNGNWTTGYISTSSDSGATWTVRTGAGNRCWRSVACSSDGSLIVAGVNGGHIYISKDSGATWADRTVGAGAILANSIAISR